MTTNFKSNGVDIETGHITRDAIFRAGDREPLFFWGTESLGSTTYGVSGKGDNKGRSEPTIVGPQTDKWSTISLGYYSFVGVKTDGTLWSWGNNSTGVLGLGDVADRSFPVQVGSLTNWKQVSASSSTLAIKTDGTLWAWGYNTNGNLGLGDTTHRSSPVQVGSLTNWKQVSASSSTLAIKTDGTLWAWGANSSGQLGLGDTTHRSSPVQVGSLTDWAFVTSTISTTLAVKTDGTLWAWGDNTYGALGLGDLVNRSSPVQVGSMTDWDNKISINMNSSVAAAIKKDGTLWMWGDSTNFIRPYTNMYSTSSVSSPVMVGTANTWTNVVVDKHVFATAII